MSEPLTADLVIELREALKSGRGNYGHRLLCGKAAEEIERLRRIEAAARAYIGTMFLSDHQPSQNLAKLHDAVEGSSADVAGEPK